MAKKKNSAKRATYAKHIGDWAYSSLWLTKFRRLKNRPMQFYSQKDPFCHRPWQIAPHQLR